MSAPEITDEKLRRSDALSGRLAALGVTVRGGSPGRLSLDLSALERLVSLAELGTELPTAVRFAHPDAGYDAEQERAARYLTPGTVYLLRGLEVGPSSSHVELDGVPHELRFNSVLFEPADPRDAD